jgi:hypothetical protein
MSEQKRRCCDLGGLDFIEVNGRKIGLIGLRQIFAEVATLGLSNPEELARELLARAEKRNWIPEKDRSAYAAALLREFWAQTSTSSDKRDGGARI